MTQFKLIVCTTCHQPGLPPELRLGLADGVLRAAAVWQAVPALSFGFHCLLQNGKVLVLERTAHVVLLQAGKVPGNAAGLLCSDPTEYVVIFWGPFNFIC